LFHKRQRLYSVCWIVMPKANNALSAATEPVSIPRGVKGDDMFLKTAALLAIAFFIAFLALAVAEVTQRQKASFQASSTYQGSDLNLLSAKDINRKTLEAADAIRVTQAERFLQHQH
jgi:preprotein translocase subunit SecG